MNSGDWPGRPFEPGGRLAAVRLEAGEAEPGDQVEVLDLGLAEDRAADREVGLAHRPATPDAYDNRTGVLLRARARRSAYSIESARASQLASMMLVEAPTVDQLSWPSDDSIETRTTVPVPAVWSTTRTLKSTSSTRA